MPNPPTFTDLVKASAKKKPARKAAKKGKKK